MIVGETARRAAAMYDQDAEKRSAARAAAMLVKPGMLVGLGTGSTVAFLLEALAERVAAGLAIRAVATSLATEKKALLLGIPVEAFSPHSSVDLALDGVDEIDPELRAIKGAGGALLREKVVAEAADRMIAIADTTKPVARLGAAPVPVEVVEFALGAVTARVDRLGGFAELREGVLTDQGNPLFDCAFGPIDDPERLAAELQAIPGVVAHGLFLTQIDALVVGTAAGAEWQQRKAR
jgi:ribose 5-phosphate isomerase A